MSTLSYSKSILMDFVTEICKEEMNKKAISYIYSSRNGKISYWEKSNLINKRTLSSVIMDEGIKNYLLSDMKKFLNDRARYESLGISWKRGYLISGPAGTGKSSLIAALANELKLKLCVIHCPRSTDDLYDLLMQAVPLRSVILLEDCDTWVNSLQSKQNNSTTKKDRDPTKDETSSELLNALDGVGCFTPGRIIFLTTNYKENIPERLIRPGRIDVNVHIGEMTIDQSKSLFKHFFTNASQDNINAFETKISELMQSKKTITSAALSSYLLSKETADDAINNIHMMCNK